MLLNAMAAHLEESHSGATAMSSAERALERANEAKRHAETLRAVLMHREPLSLAAHDEK
jgi:hypothetical protein